jgi:AraC-like DNA-binding protein
MNKSPSPQEDLLHIIQQRLIPWADDEGLRFVLVQPPFHGLEADKVERLQAPLLRSKTKSQAVNTRWPEAALNATPYPCLCCVVEGQVEWRVGITQRMQQADPAIDKRYGRYQLHLPVRSFLLMPPGIPFSDGTRPHWHSSETIPDSLLLWLHLNPQVAVLHMCRTRDGVHRSLPPIYFQDAHLLTLTELLLEDLRAMLPKMSATTRHYLLLLWLRIERILASNKLLISEKPTMNRYGEEEPPREETSPTDTNEMLAQRAQRFIQANLTTPLTVQRIADHLYISPTHLSRIFVRELGVSPMRYASAARMESARSLLVETQYPIQYISNFFGYSSPDVFSRAFKQHFNTSPQRYRHSFRNSPNHPERRNKNGR